MLARIVCCAALLVSFTVRSGARQPAPAAPTRSSTQWLGQEQRIEEHLRTARITGIEDIGTGVTRPRRAHLAPGEPVESLAWKVLPPGRRNGYWESYKSEIAAYELDRLLNLRMIPPAVERSVGNETGAAIMWVTGMKSVKELRGKVPTGPQLEPADSKDGDVRQPDSQHRPQRGQHPDRRATGDMILIDHSRAFTTDRKLQNKMERVDAELWERMQALTRESLSGALGRWLDDAAIMAILQRRDVMVAEVNKLVAKNGRDFVIIP